nr:MAG TPA: hypothetical protein [Caudoviricetes sp.]
MYSNVHRICPCFGFFFQFILLILEESRSDHRLFFCLLINLDRQGSNNRR